MRWYVVHKTEYAEPIGTPYVLAEFAEPWQAERFAMEAIDLRAISRSEMASSPPLFHALRAWETGGDSLLESEVAAVDVISEAEQIVEP